MRRFDGKAAALVLLSGVFAGCGSPSRAPIPDAPSALAVASVGNGQVSLSWTAASGTDQRFRVYLGTQAGVTKANGTRIDDVTGSPKLVAGLTNDTTYHFVVTAFNSSGESAESNEVSAMPVPPGDFTQADLTGTWRFQAIAAGTSPGWMRGTATVAADGTVVVGAFLDSAGNTTAPAGLLPVLLLDPAGAVRDAGNVGDASFTGVMGATHRNKIAGGWASGGTTVLALLLKHDPLVSFSNAVDVYGFGGTLGGARRFAYHQIATASSPQEWEFAQGQSGANSPAGGVQYHYSAGGTTYAYPFLAASGSPALPSDKASVLSVSGDGAVTEALNGTPTAAPRLVVGSDGGFMSDDKATIVATATDSSGATPRYAMRIYQLINIEPWNSSSQDMAGGQVLAFAPADLGGSFPFRELAVSDAGAPVAASGVLAIDGTTGALTFPDYADDAAGSVPAGFTLLVDSPAAQPPGKQNGILTCADDATVHGKLGDFKDLLVLTRTVSGASRLTVGVR